MKRHSGSVVRLEVGLEEALAQAGAGPDGELGGAVGGDAELLGDVLGGDALDLGEPQDRAPALGQVAERLGDHGGVALAVDGGLRAGGVGRHDVEVVVRRSGGSCPSARSGSSEALRVAVMR